MSHLSSVFNKVPVKVPNRSGFDMSHENLFTATVGTLIPASVEEVIPGDVVSIGGALNVELPPLATDFKGRVDARLETFFVPNRLLWGGWQNFITQDVNTTTPGAIGGSGVTVPGFSVATEVPTVSLYASLCGAGTLADYLGFKGAGLSSSSSDRIKVNALPFLAYQKIWDDWYRDSNIQQPFFLDGYGTESTANYKVAFSPWTRQSGAASMFSGNYTTNNAATGYNGRLVSSLAQRNFAKDYFTTMTYEPQAGAGAELVFSVDSAATTAGFSIAQLRTANSLQKWLERNNIAGTRYFDQILAHYGVLPPDANVQRAVLLGSMTTPVIVNSLSQTASNSGTWEGTRAGQNPYAGATGAQFGKGSSFGKDRLVDNFEVKEHGFIITLFSLVPHAYYGTGTRRYLYNSKSSDYAFPEFANIGDQPVYQRELFENFASTGDSTNIIGYNQRYSHYKYHDDEVHGLLADGQDLQNFVLQKGFDSGVTLGSDLLQIPTSYMDNVMVSEANISGFNAVVDAYFDSKILRVLPQYSLPSLCQNEDGGGHTVDVPYRGRRL